MPLSRIVLPVALAVAMSASAATSHAAGLLIADGGFGGQLTIKDHDVRVTINNGVAVTQIEQVFVNQEDRIVEALYTFPVPKGASVSNFSMWIGGKEMIGEVVEKQRAREIYESYKRTRRDPGLLEQVDYKTFEMRVFPIAARAEQKIRVTYYQELDADHDRATYVYPLATVTRKGIDQTTSGRFSLTLDVKSETPLVELDSPSHAGEFVVVPHSENYYQASLEVDGGDLSRDLVLGFKTSRPRTGIDVITSNQSGEDGYFQLSLTAGEELAELERGMDYVFVLDVSGSMANDSKLRLSRDAIGSFIESLGEQDRLEVMTFNVAPERLFGSVQPVVPERLAEVREFLGSRRARGGTNLRPALQTAYGYNDDDRVLNVVVLSDGMNEQREQQELLSLIRQKPGGCRVFCVGVGNEINRPLLSQLAEDAGGLAAFLSEQDNFERQAEAFRRKMMRPAIRAPRIAFTGAETYDIEPQVLPDLFHGSPIRVYGRYKSSGPLGVTVTGEVQGAPLEQTVEIELPETDDRNPEIERMWAWHRVDRLMAEERSAGNRRHQQRIVELCEGYSIASEYASFIVLENDAEYLRWKIERRNATRVARDRRAQQAVREELRRLQDRGVAQFAADRVAKPTSSPGPRLATPPAAASPSSSPMPPSQQPMPRTSRDLVMPTTPSGGGGGGGAIDPVSGLLLLGFGGMAALSRRRKAEAPS